MPAPDLNAAALVHLGSEFPLVQPDSLWGKTALAMYAAGAAWAFEVAAGIAEDNKPSWKACPCEICRQVDRITAAIRAAAGPAGG